MDPSSQRRANATTCWFRFAYRVHTSPLDPFEWNQFHNSWPIPATAAAIAIDSDIPVQEVPYDQLKKRLVSDGQILELEGPPPNTDGAINLDGIVVDDSRAELRGSWVHSAAIGPYFRKGYCHDDDGGKGYRTAKFKAKLKSGRYEVRLAYPANENRATNVPVTVYHAGGENHDNDKPARPSYRGQATLLGTFEFKDYGSVFITNKGTNGYVIADAVQFFKKMTYKEETWSTLQTWLPKLEDDTWAHNFRSTLN